MKFKKLKSIYLILITYKDGFWGIIRLIKKN